MITRISIDTSLMFGECDSVDLQVPSPWDSLTSTPSSPTRDGTQAIPKLAPEAEEGNIEYKLQLLSPSPARFARLVTQLKWRLLEGGGRAYYELGVADSGILVGLSPDQLEESLEILQMMASEVGASVTVIKEIKVPPELSSLTESQHGRWCGRRNTRRKDLLRMMKQDESPTTSPIETHTTDAEQSVCYSPTTPLTPFDDDQLGPFPTLFPFDPALATFAMDLGEDITIYPNDETPDGNIQSNTTKFSVSLEIVSVYKPRPMKKRATSPSTHYEYVKSRPKFSYLASKSADTIYHSSELITQDSTGTLFQSETAKAQFRGDKRDKQREVKHDPFLAHVPTCSSTESPTNSVDHRPSYSPDRPISSTPESFHIDIVDLHTGDTSEANPVASKGSRLMVEVLVVWEELSLDEAFLDFEGFSLQ